MTHITLTTDFGVDSYYVAQMKASIYSIAQDINVVDLSHSIPAQDVFQGALVLADTAFHFPADTIHVAVVDPGVGTERSVLAVQIEDHWFIAPDNGLLTGVMREREITESRQVTNPALWRETVSSTFHGRDIMAPVAAHLAVGTPSQEIGPHHGKLVELPWPVCQCGNEDRLIGEVVTVDSFGNLITNIFKSDVAAWSIGRNYSIAIGDRIINGFCDCYGHRTAGELVALFGSSDRLEIAVVSGNAAELLGNGLGEQILIHACD